MSNNNNNKFIPGFGNKTFPNGKGHLFLVIYAISTVCLEVLLVTTLLHTHWISHSQTSPRAGHSGLYSYCVATDNDALTCAGRLFGPSNPPVELPVLLSVTAALHIVSVVAVGGTCMVLLCSVLCGNPSRLLIVAGLGQFIAGLCLTVVCFTYPASWSWPPLTRFCGPNTASYNLGSCSLRPAFIITIVATLDAYLLAGLAVLLSRRLALSLSYRDGSLAQTVPGVSSHHQLTVIGRQTTHAGGSGGRLEQSEMMERSTAPIVSIYDDNFSLAKLEDHLI